MATQRIDRPTPGTAQLPRQELWQLIIGCFASQAISVAAQLGIADLLKNGPKHPDELAQATGAHARTLYRLLRALASVGVFVEDEQGCFGLTPTAELLQKDVPGSMHAVGLLIGSVLQWPALGHLLYTVKTGKPAFDDLYGMTQWQYMEQHPEVYELFHYAMTSFSAAEISAVLSAYDFSQVRTLVDIAGGQGKLLAAILQAYPQMRGILFDLPEVTQQAQAMFEAAGVADRSATVSGDMFVAVPSDGDLYMMKTVIHDWDDERTTTILRVCQEAMAPHARLLLITRVVAPGNAPDSSKFQDLNMLITMNGSERTAAEIETLLNAAGLSLARIIPTRSPLSIVECITR